ncbi:hypothetical protein GCM10010965_03810 [Caldalkalibacillus thermarum]|nr:hypothetical protein GCM10010965_03810 [Caldalkalibacillus thermarum]
MLPMDEMLEHRSYPQLTGKDYDLLHHRYQQTLKHVSPAEKLIKQEPPDQIDY